MILYIKYMVSPRCKLQVKQALTDISLPYRSIEYGMVHLVRDISLPKREMLSARLKKLGLELLDDDKNSLIGKLEILVAEMVKNMEKADYASFLSERLGHDYDYLSGIFSQIRGISLDQYAIITRVELVKELLLYHKRNINSIVKELHYTSTETLSDQFKKITGLTPAYFKKLREQRQSIQKNNLSLAADHSINEII